MTFVDKVVQTYRVEAGAKGPTMKTLKANKVKLTDEERKQVMDAKAVWHHGPSGEETPAVWKAQVGDQTWYVTNTHRAYNTAKSLKGAISRYHKFIKTTAATKLQFFCNCVGWPQKYMDALHYICDEGEEITRDEFLKHADVFCDEDQTVDDVLPPKDWGISYYKLSGFDLYYFIHSAIEHVFADESTIKAVQQKANEEE
jgi:hypothetical protein